MTSGETCLISQFLDQIIDHNESYETMVRRAEQLKLKLFPEHVAPVDAVEI
jgi:hypothetical protein